MSQVTAAVASIFCLMMCMWTGVERKYCTRHFSCNNMFQQQLNFLLKSAAFDLKTCSLYSLFSPDWCPEHSWEMNVPIFCKCGLSTYQILSVRSVERTGTAPMEFWETVSRWEKAEKANQLSVSLHRASCFVRLGPTRKEHRCIAFHMRNPILLCCYTHSQWLISWTISVVVQAEIAEVCAFNQLNKKMLKS